MQLVTLPTVPQPIGRVAGGGAHRWQDKHWSSPQTEDEDDDRGGGDGDEGGRDVGQLLAQTGPLPCCFTTCCLDCMQQLCDVVHNCCIQSFKEDSCTVTLLQGPL